MQWDENRAWNDPKNDEPHLGSEADPFRYVLSKPIAAPPDTVWNYNGGGTDLLGNIIERVSGKSLEAFAREALFAPLGITDWEWMKYRNGKIAAAAGLRLRPRDAAKIGQLVLNNGAWDGRQIVSAKWIEQSVTPRFQAIGYFGGLFFYGQQWWMGRTLSGDKEVKWIAGVGLGGQRLFIVPELDLVVMTTSGLYGSGRQGQAALDILANFIIPSVRDNDHAITKPGKSHEPEIHRRRPHHPPHHRAGNHLPAGAGNAAGPDAGAAGGEPGVDAKGRRARRQRRADPVLPVLCREDAASHHPDRQLHRQRQAAAASGRNGT